ncbi:unnamed protein product [Rhizophagus irregularis]|nr:unnamed protein product [Rhizophagus irregularis]
MAFDYSQELMNNYEKLLEIDKEYDVIIYAGEDEVEIYAYSLILCIRFIYCGRINLTELQGPEILNLLIAVDELNVQILIQCIQDYLVNYHYDFLQQNSMEIL